MALKLLLAEDNPGDIIIIEELILGVFPDAQIVYAKSFAEISEFSKNDIAPDVILLDLTLEDYQGELLISKVKQIYFETPIIILTGYTDFNFSIQSLNIGASDYLLKHELSETYFQKSVLYAIERQNIFKHIKETERRYSDLFQLVPLPIIVIDPLNLSIFQANPAAVSLYQYSENELAGMNIADLIYPEEFTKTPDSVEKPTVKHTLESTRHIKKDGTLIEVNISATQITIENRPLLALVVNDLTKIMVLQRQITEAIIESQETERFNIGSELHDNVCQILAACTLKMGILGKNLPASASNEFSDCLSYITMASNEIRSLSHQLSPAFYEDSTLSESIDRLLLSFKHDQAPDLVLDIEPAINEYQLDKSLHQHILRIIQEQLTNIVKHAHSTRASIHIYKDEDHLHIEISDNGTGFNVETQKNGIGLSNIRRRAEILSGSMNIYSGRGKGTLLHVTVPTSFN